MKIQRLAAPTHIYNHDRTHDYFAIVHSGSNTCDTLRVLYAKIFGKGSLVAFLTNKGDASILLWYYFVESFIEKSDPFNAIVSPMSRDGETDVIRSYSSASFCATIKPKPFSSLKLCVNIRTNSSGGFLM